ncbi:MAG: hypothetical protein ACW98X_17135 [Promethearchaeota archaeon]|jgi:hypothetical protein
MKKKSSQYLFVVFFLIGIFAIITSVKANPISSISLSYNSGTKQLDVTVTHFNGGDSIHITNLVAIKVNGTYVKIEAYTSQPSTTTLYTFDNITANVGATIEAIARCSVSGNSSNSIVVQSPPPPNGNGSPTNGEPTIPGFLGVIIITSLSITTLLTIYYIKIRKVRK